MYMVYGGFLKWGYLKLMVYRKKNHLEMDDSGVPPFQETFISSFTKTIHDTNSIALAVHAPVGIEVPERPAAAGVRQLNPRYLGAQLAMILTLHM